MHLWEPGSELGSVSAAYQPFLLQPNLSVLTQVWMPINTSSFRLESTSGEHNTGFTLVHGAHDFVSQNPHFSAVNNHRERQNSHWSFRSISEEKKTERCSQTMASNSFLSPLLYLSMMWDSHKCSSCLWNFSTSAVQKSSSSRRAMTRTWEREGLMDGEVVSEDSRTLSGTQTLFSVADSCYCVEHRRRTVGGAARSGSTTTTGDTIVTVTMV